MVTGTEPDAPASSTQEDYDYVYILLPRENVALVDTGRTETVQHHVSQSAGLQNGAPVCDTAVIDSGLRRCGVTYVVFLTVWRAIIVPE